MRIVVLVEPSDLPEQKPVTRKELAQKLGCHINSLRSDEILIKQWVDNSQKYYRNPNTEKLESVELTPYLAWLLIQVRVLRRKFRTSKALISYIFNNQHLFTEKEFESYVQHRQQQNRKAKRIRIVESSVA